MSMKNKLYNKEFNYSKKQYKKNRRELKLDHWQDYLV